MRGHASRKGNSDGLVMEANCRRRRALDLENELEKRERETASGRVPGKDDLRCWNRCVQRIWRRAEEGEIDEENVQKGGGKWIFRGKAIAD